MKLALRELCGYRAGDKGDIANVAIFADDDETYSLIAREVTSERVKEHFGSMVQGRVDRYEVPNVRALNFVLSARSAAAAPGRCGPTASARPLGARSYVWRSTCPRPWRAGAAHGPTWNGQTRFST